MFLNQQTDSLPAKINLKRALVFTLGFALSITIVFVLVYWQIHLGFEAQDKKYLKLKVSEFSHRIEIRGLADFVEYINSGLGVEDDSALFIQLYSPLGHLLYENDVVSKWNLGSLVLNDIRSMATDEVQYSEQVASGQNRVLFSSHRMRGGEVLLLAKDSQFRQANLENINMIFWLSLAPVALIGFLVSYYASYRVTSPIWEMTSILKKAHLGDFSHRLPVGLKKDEYFELRKMINQILDQAEQNIGSLRDAFDHLTHDIRTPVTRLRGRAELALEGEESIEIYREALQSCFENSDKILRFFETLTQISEAENRSLKLKKEKKSLKFLVEEILDLYEIAFEEKEITIHRNFVEDDEVEIDSNLVKRALANLLDNAHKYNPQGANVTVRTFKDGDFLVLSVEDDGPGIPFKEQDIIWNRLYRGDKSRSVYGMGLGLTFVKAIVEAHGGSVNLRSPCYQGRGSSFELRFIKGIKSRTSYLR
ncbi:MAG: sensor histidine kinase [Bdellovibrionia bacterium]